MDKMCLILLLLLFAGVKGGAVDFKEKSVLSSGKWVKVGIGQTGVYELDYERLRSYGFSSPERVKVFGEGGNVANESFKVAFTDDLEQIPALHENGKLYFYAKGAVKNNITVYREADFLIYDTPEPNPYSRYGYYFLTDSEDYDVLEVERKPSADVENVGRWLEKGVCFWEQERELINPGMSGKNFLGEDLVATDGAISYQVPLPLLDKEGTLYLNNVTAAMTSGSASMSFKLNGKAFTVNSSNKLSANSEVDYLDYGLLRVHGELAAEKLGTVGETAVLDVKCTSEGTLLRGWVDFVSLAYPAQNALPADSVQTVRYIGIGGAEEGVRISGFKPSLKVWLVDDSSAEEGLAYPVVDYELADNGDGTAGFVPGAEKRWAEFIIFDTDKRQLAPLSVENVANQNIHAENVPDMLVITNKLLYEQAERLADFHRTHDGMDVLVLEQNAVFNEFSSGVRDAMAYRRVAKMFYDRNPSKMRYLLLFGGGTYDNRMLAFGEDSDMLLTYQSEESTSQVKSYSTDDFFGVVADGSSGTLAGKDLNIAVGRIPFNTEEEASAYVDKLISYVSQPVGDDYAWMNNMLLIGEDGDDDIHTDQCETFKINFEEMASVDYDMNVSKIYFQAYADVSQVRRDFVNLLNKGQSVVLFVGHGNPTSITKQAGLYSNETAESTEFEHIPIWYLSSCDIARFDCGSDFLAGPLLLNRKGGMIAAVASTRVVYTNLNGKLSDSFARSLAKSEDYYGGEKTLGRILVDAKNNSSENSINRLKYHLFGDPALPVRIPKSRIRLTKAGGMEASEGSTLVVPSTGIVEFEGVVETADGVVDNAFNGSVIVNLFDADADYTTTKVTSGNSRPSVTVQDRGAELACLRVGVKNGKFSGRLAVSSFVASDKAVMPVRMVAADEAGTVVAGCCRMLEWNQEKEMERNDRTAPRIDAFYIDSEDSFSDGATVGSDVVFIAELSDDTGLNTSTEVLASSMQLSIDGGKDSYPVSGYVPTDERSGRIEMPVNGLTDGRHTAELMISDLSGNVARKSISFFVSEPVADCWIEVEEKALRDVATIRLSDNAVAGDVYLWVTDSAGNVWFRESVSSFPYEWNVKDIRGNRLPAGVYNLYGVIDGKSTVVKKIVVLKQ